MTVYARKLYALLSALANARSLRDRPELLAQLESSYPNILNQSDWWESHKTNPQEIASSSDRVNLTTNQILNQSVKHPISGQNRNIKDFPTIPNENFNIPNNLTEEELFWWFWRFLPELIREQNNYPEFFLYPAHNILPDCPLHSYNSTVSALVGAMYPENWQENTEPERPYLFLFTFSPVQEFIKASRKFADFWAGSYLLHYLGAKICWKIAELYGPDAVITPSLWQQEIIDALMAQKYPDFVDNFAGFQDGRTPAARFNDSISTSLSTAGFPNIITALVPGKEAAKELGDILKKQLTEEWSNIAKKVREDIKTQTLNFLNNPQNEPKIQEIVREISPVENIQQICHQDLNRWISGCQGSCWEWNKLWEAQINRTWETYWTAIPLGDPNQELRINPNPEEIEYQEWKEAQNAIAPPHLSKSIPTEAEERLYETLNTGTWWGALQAHLGQSIQAVKNTRTWAISTAPGERSTLSGQFSAVHPQLNYHQRFKNGFGMSARSMRLFWLLIAEVYPGLFNGSEKLNAIELTKRMAWRYGGVAESLGIDLGTEDDTNYDNLIRFPNLSSIAAARFVYEDFQNNGGQKTRNYWNCFNRLINQELPNKKDTFWSRTCGRPYQIPKVDGQINLNNANRNNFNGVMFSSKWLADDMNCNEEEKAILRGLVEKAHKQANFGEGSPSDWWVIVVGDGDGMGKYVSGSKLETYQAYLIEEAIAPDVREHEQYPGLLKTKKRMGPATHVGLNRALLDFSNRLVPYLTQERYCGKVVYSGGDDVMAVLPLADLPGYLRSLRSAWCADSDPEGEFSSEGGYWTPTQPLPGLQQRPYFTMGKGATISFGIVIAHKSVPLPTVLESLWTAEQERAKNLYEKDGLCFRVIYGSGNTLEALMKGKLLDLWWKFMQDDTQDISPLLYRLAEELPRHACLTESDRLFRKAAEVIINSREEQLNPCLREDLLNWIDHWETWAYQTHTIINQNINMGQEEEKPLGTTAKDLANLLRFSAFWNDKIRQQMKWGEN